MYKLNTSSGVLWQDDLSIRYLDFLDTYSYTLLLDLKNENGFVIEKTISYSQLSLKILKYY